MGGFGYGRGALLTTRRVAPETTGLSRQDMQMATHLEMPRTQWTGKQAAWLERAMPGRQLRTLFAGDFAHSAAIAKRYRELVDLFERANTRLSSELSDRARSHYSSKEV